MEDVVQADEVSGCEFLRQQAFIGGQWIDADTGGVIEVRNPATGSSLGSVPNMGAKETSRAIDAAGTALAPWRERTAQERAVILRRWFDLIVTNQDALARLLTAEQGKPLAEAKSEIVYAASSLNGSRKKVSASTGMSSCPTRPTSAYWCSSNLSGLSQRSRRGIFLPR